MVNSVLVGSLVSMGYSKNVSEKALLLSGNKSLDGALGWINKHSGDDDYEEQMFMQQEPKKKSKFDGLSKDEIREIAKELQEQARVKRKAKDIAEARRKE